MKRIALAVALLIAVAVIWRFPLFRVVRLDVAPPANELDKFSATKFAETFWNERLRPSLDQSADAAVVIEALRRQPHEASERFGRSIGIGRVRLLCVRGAGTIVSVDKRGVGISLGDTNGAPDIFLQTGLLFGNTVRDVSGLLDASEFSNSQHYNEVSTELNRIVETQVIAELKEDADVGTAITFIACGQLLPDPGSAIPLKMIPLKVDFEEASTPSSRH